MLGEDPRRGTCPAGTPGSMFRHRRARQPPDSAPTGEHCRGSSGNWSARAGAPRS
ncbi:hypothetical protein QJS66_20330 [Kocuria rhizophila]|nr:hypothetical protein QJS66_20330 [Kocuria rhizophila]